MPQPTLTEMIAAHSRAESLLLDRIRASYPEGAAVFWMVGNRLHSGHIVVGMTYGDLWHARFKIHNSATGRDYWVNAAELVETTEAQAAALPHGE